MPSGVGKEEITWRHSHDEDCGDGKRSLMLCLKWRLHMDTLDPAICLKQRQHLLSPVQLSHDKGLLLWRAFMYNLYFQVRVFMLFFLRACMVLTFSLIYFCYYWTLSCLTTIPCSTGVLLCIDSLSISDMLLLLGCCSSPTSNANSFLL